MMWVTPVAAVVMVLLVSIVAAAISARPVMKLDARRGLRGALDLQHD